MYSSEIDGIYHSLGWLKKTFCYSSKKTVTWHAGDSAYAYESRGKNKSMYDENSFSYHFNEHRFRCNSFNTIDHSKLKILYLGCSFTVGEAVPMDVSWAYRLNQKINKDLNYYNLAQSGRGIDYSARILYKHIDHIKPNVVLGLFPVETRSQLLSRDQELLNYMAKYDTTIHYKASPDDIKKYYHAYEYITTSNNYYKDNEFYSNLRLIKNLCLKNNSLFYWTSWTTREILIKDNNLLDFKFRHLAGDYGRDGLHPGPASHQAFADKMYDFLLKNHNDIFN